jgi:hypothetical protein
LEGEIQMADRARRRRRNKIIDGLKEALAHARGESTGIRGVARPSAALPRCSLGCAQTRCSKPEVTWGRRFGGPSRSLDRPSGVQVVCRR